MANLHNIMGGRTVCSVLKPKVWLVSLSSPNYGEAIQGFQD